MLRFLFLGFPLTATLLLASCGDEPPKAPPPPQPIMDGSALRFPAGHPQLPALKTLVAEAPVAIEVEMPARVVWDEDRTQRIYPAFSGRVSQIRADVGTPVKAGQILLELASPEFGLAQADAARARAEVMQARRQLERVKDLHGLGIAARKELEQAETDAERTQAELERAQARIRLYGGAEAINQQLSIIAGMSGVIVERNVNPGQELRPDQYGPGATALFVLTNPENLWLQIDVRENHLSLFAPGGTIEFVAHAYPGRRFQAKVLAISDVIDPVSRTLKVRASVGNLDRLLKVEMLGKVSVSQPPPAGVVVPATAVYSGGDAHWAYVSTRPGAFEPRRLEVSYLGSDRVLVREGLKPGDTVVVENTLLLARMYRMAREAAEHRKPGSRDAAR